MRTACKQVIVDLTGAARGSGGRGWNAGTGLRAAQRRRMGLWRLPRSTRAHCTYLSTRLPEIADPLTRGAAWVTMWDALLSHSVEARALRGTRDSSALPKRRPMNSSRAACSVTSAVPGGASSRLPNVRRASCASKACCAPVLTNAKTASQKASWFGALRNVFATAETTAWLRSVWEQKETVEGLPLAEADYTNLALDLAVREVEGWRDILTHATGAHRESGSERTVRVRDAGAVG